MTLVTSKLGLEIHGQAAIKLALAMDRTEVGQRKEGAFHAWKTLTPSDAENQIGGASHWGIGGEGMDP